MYPRQLTCPGSRTTGGIVPDDVWAPSQPKEVTIDGLTWADENTSEDRCRGQMQPFGEQWGVLIGWVVKAALGLKSLLRQLHNAEILCTGNARKRATRCRDYTQVHDFVARGPDVGMFVFHKTVFNSAPLHTGEIRRKKNCKKYKKPVVTVVKPPRIDWEYYKSGSLTSESVKYKACVLLSLLPGCLTPTSSCLWCHTCRNTILSFSLITLQIRATVQLAPSERHVGWYP